MQRIVWKLLFLCLCFWKLFNFLNMALYSLRLGQPFKKIATHKNWKLSEVNYQSRSNMPNDAYTTLKFRTFSELGCFIFVVKTSERLWRVDECINNEVWRRLSWVLSLHLFLKTNLCKIFWHKLRNQVKFDKAKKLWYLFLPIFWRPRPKVYLSSGDWTFGCVPTQF